MDKKRRDAVMKIFFISLLLSPLFLFAKIETTQIGGIEFAYRLPQTVNSNTRVMVLFGGRNWRGEKTLRTFGFDGLADKHSLILLSPSFKDNEYWQPEKWSGAALKSAVKSIEQKFKLKPQKLFFYGYSAGGQCANLFYNYMPKQVAAWGLHACGVYPQKPRKNGAAAFITCGLGDADRVRISRTFIYKYRENGGSVIWKTYSGGHELNKEALDFARQFFDDVLCGKTPVYVGEDDTMRILPISKILEIDAEFRNMLSSEKLKRLWEAR